MIKSGSPAVNSGKMRKNFAGGVKNVHDLGLRGNFEDRAGYVEENWMKRTLDWSKSLFL